MPFAASLPSRSTVTRSAIVRTAARSWEMKMTLEPCATTSRMRSNRNCSSSSGRKTVGSSSTSTEVVEPVRSRYSRSSSAARAMATSAWPTGGSSLTTVRGSIVTPYDSNIVRALSPSARQSTRKREYSSRAAAPTRFSSTVSGRARPRSWCTKLRPTSWNPPAGIGSTTGSPPITSVPPGSGSCTPASTLINVDLPLPFSPSRAWTSPCATERSTPSSARVAPNCLEMFESSSAVSIGGECVRVSGQGVYGSDAGLFVHRS